MKCMICGNDNLEYRDTVISDFVMDRISEDFVPGKNRKTRLCYCPECTFAFYEYRMTDEEQGRLYRNYRDEEYQKTREKYECWYTPKINEALNNDRLALARGCCRRTVIRFRRFLLTGAEMKEEPSHEKWVTGQGMYLIYLIYRPLRASSLFHLLKRLKSIIMIL